MRPFSFLTDHEQNRSPKWLQVKIQGLFWRIFNSSSLQIVTGESKKEKTRWKKKKKRQLIFKKQRESRGKPYSFLGCNTISVSATLSTFRDRKSAPRCDFSTALFTCHHFFLPSWSKSFNVSFPCLCIDRKGPKDSDFPGFSFHKKSSKQSRRRRSSQAFCEIASIL